MAPRVCGRPWPGFRCKVPVPVAPGQLKGIAPPNLHRGELSDLPFPDRWGSNFSALYPWNSFRHVFQRRGGWERFIFPISPAEGRLNPRVFSGCGAFSCPSVPLGYFPWPNGCVTKKPCVPSSSPPARHVSHLVPCLSPCPFFPPLSKN